MTDQSLDFLMRLLATPGPSGDEAAAARLWREQATSFADRVWADVRGSSFAALDAGPSAGSGQSAPRVLLAGHIDEIGVMITYIDSDGFLFFTGVGGWDAQVLVGQRVRLLGKAGDVIGVVGKRPIHLLKGDERDRASKIEDLWIDI
nr:M42 family peptidase [Chloroflexota bacterium]